MKKCIFFVVDKNLYPQLITTLNSLLPHIDESMDLVICSINLELIQKDAISQLCRCIFIDFHNISWFVGPVMVNVINKVNPESFWSRFLIWFDPIFQKYDFVLYLDVDLIILKSLNGIFSEDFYIENDMQVNAKWLFVDSYDSIIASLLNEDNIVLSQKMANAGVFCVARKFISVKVRDEFVYLLSRYGKYLKFADQSLINIWLCKNNIRIQKNNVFNLQYRNIFNKNFISNLKIAHIVHFNGLKNLDRLVLMRLYFLLFLGPVWFLLHAIVYMPFCFKNFIFRAFKKLGVWF